MRSRGAVYSSADITTAWPMETFGTIATSPAGAPSSGAISLAASIGISHHPFAHARTPNSAHVSTYSASRSGTDRGMAPSECETRYVVRSRIGNSARNASSGSFMRRSRTGSARWRRERGTAPARQHEQHGRPGEHEDEHTPFGKCDRREQPDDHRAREDGHHGRTGYAERNAPRRDVASAKLPRRYGTAEVDEQRGHVRDDGERPERTRDRERACERGLN